MQDAEIAALCKQLAAASADAQRAILRVEEVEGAARLAVEPARRCAVVGQWAVEHTDREAAEEDREEPRPGAEAADLHAAQLHASLEVLHGSFPFIAYLPPIESVLR